VWRAKAAESRRVKYGQVTLLLITAFFASLALAEDFKTINGKEYKNATISRVEPDGIILRTKTGITKVYFTELPKEVADKWLAPVLAAHQAAQGKRIEAQNAAEREHAEKGVVSTIPIAPSRCCGRWCSHPVGGGYR